MKYFILGLFFSVATVSFSQSTKTACEANLEQYNGFITSKTNEKNQLQSDIDAAEQLIADKKAKLKKASTDLYILECARKGFVDCVNDERTAAQAKVIKEEVDKLIDAALKNKTKLEKCKNCN